MSLSKQLKTSEMSSLHNVSVIFCSHILNTNGNYS